MAKSKSKSADAEQLTSVRDMVESIWIAIVLALYMCDNLLNAMFNPVFLLLAGGLAGALAADWARGASR